MQARFAGFAANASREMSADAAMGDTSTAVKNRHGDEAAFLVSAHEDDGTKYVQVLDADGWSLYQCGREAFVQDVAEIEADYLRADVAGAETVWTGRDWDSDETEEGDTIEACVPIW